MSMRDALRFFNSSLNAEIEPTSDTLSVPSPFLTRKTTTAFLKPLYHAFSPSLVPTFENPAMITKLNQLFFNHRSPNRTGFLSDTVHRCLPAMNIPPVDNSPIPSEQYGIVNMNSLQFFMRPCINNVHSCHSFTIEDSSYHPMGQLSYLANPFWLCFGLYRNSAKGRRAELRSEDQQWITDKDVNLPNLVATFNVLICLNPDNKASAMISRGYGGCDKGVITRLTAVLEAMGFIVYASASSSAYGVAHQYEISKLSGTAPRVTLKSFPMPLFAGCIPYSNTSRIRQFGYVKRYNDIDHPQATRRSGVEGASVPLQLLQEVHSAMRISPPNCTANYVVPVEAWARKIYGTTDVLQSAQYSSTTGRDIQIERRSYPLIDGEPYNGVAVPDLQSRLFRNTVFQGVAVDDVSANSSPEGLSDEAARRILEVLHMPQQDIDPDVFLPLQYLLQDISEPVGV